MAAVANNPEFASEAGVPQSVGREYMKADKGRFAGGGLMKEVPEDKKSSLGKLPEGVRNKMGYMAGGGNVKKMNKGGMCRGNGIAQRGQGRINFR